MESSGTLRRVARVKSNVSEGLSASIIRVTRIGELGTTLSLTSNRRTLRRLLVAANVLHFSPILVTFLTETLRSSDTSILTRTKGRNTPEDDILRSHCREILKSYMIELLNFGAN
jgi:hypothetical protein